MKHLFWCSRYFTNSNNISLVSAEPFLRLDAKYFTFESSLYSIFYEYSRLFSKESFLSSEKYPRPNFIQLFGCYKAYGICWLIPTFVTKLHGSCWVICFRCPEAIFLMEKPSIKRYKNCKWIALKSTFFISWLPCR